MEHRVKKKRKIAESVWVHNVVTVRTGKVAGQCAMPSSTSRRPVYVVHKLYVPLCVLFLSLCVYWCWLA